MAASRKPSRPRTIDLALCLFVAGITLATSEVDDGKSTGASSTHEEWRAPSQAFEVTVQPVGDRVASIDYSGSYWLAIRIHYIPQALEGAPRWAVQFTEDGETIELRGDFIYEDGEVQTQDNGELHRDIRGEIGRLCHEGETSKDGCLPCVVETGCTFRLEIDACDPAITGFIQANLDIARDDNELFEWLCVDGDGSDGICDGLSTWLDMELIDDAVSPDLCAP